MKYHIKNCPHLRTYSQATVFRECCTIDLKENDTSVVVQAPDRGLMPSPLSKLISRNGVINNSTLHPLGTFSVGTVLRVSYFPSKLCSL